MRFSWHESMSVGNTRLDDQHRQLMQLLSGLSLAVDEGYVEAAQTAVMEFQELSTIHFADEEKLFPEDDLSSKAKHLAAHRKAESRIEGLRHLVCDEADIAAMRQALKERLVEIVVDLFSHDRAVAQHVKELERRKFPRLTGQGIKADIGGAMVDVVDISVDSMTLRTTLVPSVASVAIGLIPRIRGALLESQRIETTGTVERADGDCLIIKFAPEEYGQTRAMIHHVLNTTAKADGAVVSGDDV